MISRRVKLIRIGQAHLARNMNLIKWREITERYNYGPGRLNLDSLSDNDLDRLLADIKRVIFLVTRGLQRDQICTTNDNTTVGSYHRTL